MKTWLLDADITIDFLSLGVLDKLVRNHEVYVSSSVAGEITHYYKGGVKYPVEFRRDYIQNGLVKEISATSEDIVRLFEKLPPSLHPTIHSGEIESVAILFIRADMLLCSCDAALIRIMPILDLSERGISAERLLKEAGLTVKNLQSKHTEKYFRNNLAIGQENKIYLKKGK